MHEPVLLWYSLHSDLSHLPTLYSELSSLFCWWKWGWKWRQKPIGRLRHQRSLRSPEHLGQELLWFFYVTFLTIISYQICFNHMIHFGSTCRIAGRYSGIIKKLF